MCTVHEQCGNELEIRAINKVNSPYKDNKSKQATPLKSNTLNGVIKCMSESCSILFYCMKLVLIHRKGSFQKRSLLGENK